MSVPVDWGTRRFTVEVAGGWEHTCARLDDRTLKCSGQNAFGQLGQGDTVSLGSRAEDMGDALPRILVP